MIGKQYTDDYIKAISFIFFDRYKKEYATDPAWILYNSYLIQISNKLKEEEHIDLKLPHCWYRWGDMVSEEYLPFIVLDCSELDKATVSFNGIEPNIDEDDLTKYASRFADRFIGTYMTDVGSAIDKIYTDAPYGFLNRYRALKETLALQIADDSCDRLPMLFDETMDSFPDDFESITIQKNEFVAVFNEAIKNNVRTEDLLELADDFWSFFCCHLRIRCNENIDHETLELWNDKLSMENTRYEASIQNYAFQLCSSSESQAIIELLSERTERLSKLDRMLDEL